MWVRQVGAAVCMLGVGPWGLWDARRSATRDHAGARRAPARSQRRAWSPPPRGPWTPRAAPARVRAGWSPAACAHTPRPAVGSSTHKRRTRVRLHTRHIAECMPATPPAHPPPPPTHTNMWVWVCVHTETRARETPPSTHTHTPRTCLRCSRAPRRCVSMARCASCTSLSASAVSCDPSAACSSLHCQRRASSCVCVCVCVCVRGAEIGCVWRGRGCRGGGVRRQ
jgi:hypothetical protein